MKKIALLLITVAFGLLSQAQEESRLVISAGQMKNITLGENMKVLLVVAGPAQDEIKMDVKLFEKLSISVIDGAMHISSRKKLSDNETVVVLVNELSRLTVGQNTKVSSEGILRTGPLKVFVQEGAVARIKTTAQVDGYSVDGLDVFIKKTPVNIRVQAKVL